MQSHFEEASTKLKRERSISPEPSKTRRSISPEPSKTRRSISPQPSKTSQKKSLDIGEIDEENGDDRSFETTSNQLVLYKPDTSNSNHDVLDMPACTENHTSSYRSFLGPNSSSRVLPSIGAFTVQCAACFKWRLIPTKEKYEEIRERILQEPFECDRAREWRPDISCDDPADISQDGSRLWAIDKPNIAQPPPGWERLLRIRGEGSTKFADVYYRAPSGKRFRSMVEIERYLLEHPEYVRQGVNLSQFSFRTPRPLQENYVRKRPARLPNPFADAGLEMPSLEPVEVNPLSWAAPPTPDEQQISGPCLSSPYFEQPPVHRPPVEPPPPPARKKKKATGPSSWQMYGNPVYTQPTDKLEDTQQESDTW